MRIKSKEWVAFKEQFLAMLSVLGDETENFDFPEEPENFEIFVRECEVHPIFMKKQDSFKVEYDFTLCETKIRTLSFSIYRDSARIEMTLKSGELKIGEGKVTWQETLY
ncbi:MAG: hypothetical protein FJY17_00085 [Bacteroidetes bacterium]|nr:hypothetical protein [Bacteroidota bacterium]